MDALVLNEPRVTQIATQSLAQIDVCGSESELRTLYAIETLGTCDI
jgi:hypothetical protein